MGDKDNVGIRVGVPAFFALELEDVYRHSEGAHRALAFPDFVGWLVGMGLEQYRKRNAPPPEAAQEETPEDIEELTENDQLHNKYFRDFDEAMERTEPPEYMPRSRFVRAGKTA